jgi:tRNA uridine 5-carbamoylmethylation protein Kti12
MIFLISGVPGSGKSSVSRELMNRFNRGVHIPVDDLREMVVSGIAHPVPVWTEETGRQFVLARASAIKVATIYNEAGFAVVIDDVISSENLHKDYIPNFGNLKPYPILLLPSKEVNLQRNATRENKNFDTTILEQVIGYLYEELSQMDHADWLVIDSSDLTLEQTVDLILARVGVSPQK